MLEVIFVCVPDVSFSSPKKKVFVKAIPGEPTPPARGAVRSLPPVKIKYETFIIRGGLI